MTRTTHLLPFSSLSPGDFERLCLGLVCREGYDRPQHLGAAGSDDGRDILAFRKGRRVVFQCKRYERLGPRDAEGIVGEILALPVDERPAELIVLATCNVSAEARRRARARAGVIDCEIWALTELDERVHRHPDLMAQFFDLPCHSPHLGYRCLAPRPHVFVDRSEYQSIRELLIAAAADRNARTLGITTALRGAGGFGKTTLAEALCHDQRVQGAYPDGILWLTMDEQLTDGDRLSRVRDLLRRWRGIEPPAFETLDAAGGFLRDLLAGKRVLVVVDDVWSPRDLSPFRDIDPASTLFATTRDRRNLPDGCRAVDVDAMATAEAVELLGTGVPGLSVERLRDLTRRLGEWPLLLSLAHQQLRERVDDEGLPPERALAEVEAILAEEGLEAFDRQDVEARALAVGRTLNASLRRLTEDERQRYERLAIFPEHADIPCPTLAGLWSLSLRHTLDLCRRLHQLSLAVRFDSGAQTLGLHDVMRSCLCARARAVLADRHREFLDARRPAGGWQALPPPEPYLWRRLAYHLVEAGSRVELRALLLDYDWLEAKLAATDVNALLADFDALPDDPDLRLVQSALRLSAHVIADHPEELPGQLVGRLVRRAEPGVVALRERARPSTLRPWLRPLTASLPQAGGALIRTLIDRPRQLVALGVLPDGRVVSKGYQGYMGSDEIHRVWDLATGETRMFEGHVDWVPDKAVLPDGRVVSGCEDGTLRVWNLATGETTRTLKGHSRKVNAVAVLCDGRVVSGSDDGTLRVWDLATGETARILEGHWSGVTAVAALPDGRVVSGEAGGTLRVWDLAGETAKSREHHADAVRSVGVLPDGRVVTGSNDGALRVWDLATGGTTWTLEGHSGGIRAMAVLPDGRVVSGSYDGMLRVWDLATGETTRALEGESRWRWVNAVAVLPDGRVVSGYDDGTVRVWDLDAGEASGVAYRGRGAEVMAVLPDGRVVSACGAAIDVWDLATGESTRIFETSHRGFEGGTRGITALAMLPDGRAIAGWDDGSMLVVELAMGETARRASATVASPKGKTVSRAQPAPTTSSSSLSPPTTTAKPPGIAWSCGTATILEGVSHWPYRGDPIRGLAVFPDGRIVSSSADHTLRVWDVATGAIVARLSLDAEPTALAVVGERGIVAGDHAGSLHFLRLEDRSAGVASGAQNRARSASGHSPPRRR